jgi:cytoskeletal protein RodZ
VDLATRQAAKAGERDGAMQRLRDLTLSVAIAALGAVGLLAWVSAATIPGQTGSSQQPASTGSSLASNATGDDVQPSSAVAPAGSGSALAVSGASR